MLYDIITTDGIHETKCQNRAAAAESAATATMALPMAAEVATLSMS